VIAVDNGSLDESPKWLDGLAAGDSRLRAVHCDHFLGAAAGRNVALKQSRGRYVVLLDTSVEVTGDVFSPLAEVLGDDSVGVAGAWGVATGDLRTFEDARGPDVDAVEAYLMAFRRERVGEVGLMDEKYRFYRHLDLDYSLRSKPGIPQRPGSGLPCVATAQRMVAPGGGGTAAPWQRNLPIPPCWGGRRDLLVARALAELTG
jgi:GT2 family glycosyltransferase